jgi:hypothetical protein
MNYLIYVNGLGPNYRGDNMYEFIFSDELDVWGESWDSKPSSGYPEPPHINYIKKVGTLRKTSIDLELIQKSDYMGMTDAMEDIIALAWETEESSENNERLVFRFGETEDKVKDKLYARDLILEFEKETVYEK